MALVLPRTILSLSFTLLLAVACQEEERPPLLGTVSPSDDAGGADGNGDGDGDADEKDPDEVTSDRAIKVKGSALVGYFYDDDGFIIVSESGVIQYSWEGEAQYEWTSERALISSGYLNKTLVVGDSGAITTLDETLQVVQETQVVEACAAGVMTSKGFICGPDEDWDRILYTYAPVDGALLATSDGHTYAGIPLIAVPGRDLAVSVSGGSPSDYHLYKLEEDGTPVYVSDSPYHGDFAVSTETGFIGDPATHLVTPGGLMLNFVNADCEPDIYPSACFSKDGNLGTLPGEGAEYVAFSNSQNKEIYALVDPGGRGFATPCEEGCILQRISVEERDLLTSKVVGQANFGVADSDTDAPAEAYYLFPSPDGDSVWMIASGRSIYDSGYRDFLSFRISEIDMTVNSGQACPLRR